MSGFPNRANRAALGPTYEEWMPVTDPNREISAAIQNLDFWQLAGVSQTAPLGILLATVSGGAVTTAAQSLAWDPNGALGLLSWTYEAAGAFSFAFSSQYPDQRGTSVNLILAGATVVPYRLKDGKYDGSHTGANNQAVLTDSGQAWTINEHAGKTIYNLTDGSKATVASNTADTVTGALGGGTDNDWDTSDRYLILDDVLDAAVQLTTDYEGIVSFRDSAGDLADPTGFLLLLY
jgi:hypothetical protein